MHSFRLANSWPSIKPAYHRNALAWYKMKKTVRCCAISIFPDMILSVKMQITQRWKANGMKMKRRNLANTPKRSSMHSIMRESNG